MVAHNLPSLYSATPPSTNYVGLNLQKEFDVNGVEWAGYFNVHNIFYNPGVLDTNSAVQGITYLVSADDDIMGSCSTLGVRVRLEANFASRSHCTGQRDGDKRNVFGPKRSARSRWLAQKNVSLASKFVHR
jgi:hypothetical protein